MKVISQCLITSTTTTHIDPSRGGVRASSLDQCKFTHHRPLMLLVVVGDGAGVGSVGVVLILKWMPTCMSDINFYADTPQHTVCNQSVIRRQPTGRS
jgi:hypothetical protein